MLTEWHLLYNCHLVICLPARCVHCKLLLLSWSNGREGGSPHPHPSTVSRMPPVPLTKWALWLTPIAGRDCRFMRWTIGRQMHPNHINWNLLSQDSSISISLWTPVCYTWNLTGVGISSLIAYIPNLLSLPIFLLQAIMAKNQFATCAHPYSVFPISGKSCPGKNK